VSHTLLESQQANTPLIQLGDLPGVLQTGLVQPVQKIEPPTQVHPLDDPPPLDEVLPEEVLPEEVLPEEVLLHTSLLESHSSGAPATQQLGVPASQVGSRPAILQDAV